MKPPTDKAIGPMRWLWSLWEEDGEDGDDDEGLGLGLEEEEAVMIGLFEFKKMEFCDFCRIFTFDST